MELLLALILLGITLLSFYAASRRNKQEKPGYRVLYDDEEIMVSYNPIPTRYPTRKRKPHNFKWAKPGKTVKIRGYIIPDGMIYYGMHLNRNPDGGFVEPGFIDTTLPTDSPKSDRSGKNLEYYPSYSSIPPSSRQAYLEWLAGGRSDPEINIGYVVMFFCGLERRLLYDTQQMTVSTGEISSILDELKRLGEIYCTSTNPFGYYLNSLLEFVQILQIEKNRTKFYDFDPPPGRYKYEIPPIIRLALGQLAMEGKPLPADWMHSYVVNNPEINLRTAAERCKHEFKKLFITKYNNTFKDGIRIKPNTTGIAISYRCAYGYGYSYRYLGYISDKFFDLPDVCHLRSLQNRVEPIIDECRNELDKLSRWLGRFPEKKDSLDTFSLLPAELIDLIGNTAYDGFKQWVGDQMNGQDHAVVQNDAIFSKWPTRNPDKMTKPETTMFIELLDKMGLGIEPDIRFGGNPIKKSDISVLFKLEDKKVIHASDEYLGLSILVQLAVSVAKADGKVTEDELSVLKDLIDHSSRLDPAEKWRMTAYLKWLLNSDIGAQGVKQRIKSITPGQKTEIANVLILVAGADGYISPEEIDLMTKLYKTLDQDPQAIFSNLHLYQVDKKRTNDEPVTVKRAGTGEPGYAIPPPAPPAKKGFKLDHDKIKHTLRETNEVSAVLKELFEDDEPDVPEETEIIEHEDTPTESVHGLDSNYMSLLMAFQTQSVWTKAEFASLAAKHDLLPDGALDVLNETALDICDEELCDGEDPMEINHKVLEELIK